MKTKQPELLRAHFLNLLDTCRHLVETLDHVARIAVPAGREEQLAWKLAHNSIDGFMLLVDMLKIEQVDERSAPVLTLIRDKRP